MKYFLTVSLLFIFLFSCSDSESTEELDLEVIVLPTLSTSAATNIGVTSAAVGGTVSNDGGSTVTERGIVWSTNSDPTTSDNKETEGSGIGSYTVSLSGLEANTTYFVKAYAINGEGIAYGSQQQFTTLESQPVQKVFEGDVVLTSQQEIDEFGAQTYTEIKGSLTIRDTNSPSSVKNLEPLNSLISISGTVMIEENNELVDLLGFSELKIIEGDLVISKNDALETIESFSRLESINGNLQIYNEIATFSLRGFDALISIGASMDLSNIFPGKISEIAAFNNLALITEFAYVDGIEGEVDAFGKLKEVGKGLTITRVNQVENLLFLSSLETVFGTLTLTFNDALQNLNGLQSLKQLGGLYLWANNSLTTLTGMGTLSYIGSLYLSSNLDLLDLSGLQNIERVGSIDIQYNDGLQSLKGLENLKTIDQGLSIVRNNALENLSGLEGLQVMGAGGDCIICFGDITIDYNPNLLDIDALENLTTAWNGDINIRYNEKLENLDGLRNLVNIYKSSSDTGGSGAEIQGNASLNDVCGLKTVYENNSSRYYISGFSNGTVHPEGDALAMLLECD